MKTFLIGNTVYLPINKEWESKTSQKYVKADMNSNVYMSKIYTEEEIRECHKDSDFNLIEVDSICELVEAYSSKFAFK